MSIGNAVSGNGEVSSFGQMGTAQRSVTIQNEQSQQNQQSEGIQKNEKVDLESFQGLLKNVNEEMKPYDTQLEFSVHEKTKQVMIKVVNTATNETVREIPSEKLMDIMANLLEVAGILVDVKA